MAFSKGIEPSVAYPKGPFGRRQSRLHRRLSCGGSESKVFICFDMVSGANHNPAYGESYLLSGSYFVMVFLGGADVGGAKAAV
jgi:hypothetical protein